MKKLFTALLLGLTLFAHSAHAYDIAKTLKYLSRDGRDHLFRDYNYTPPMGGFVNNDETEFNAIVFSDDSLTFNPLTWPQITDNDAAAANWYTNYYFWIESIPPLKSKLDALPTNAALTTTLAGKVDKTTTVNGQSLSGNVTITTVSGNAGTATALAANGTNCSAGQYARGVDASGNAENCTNVAGTRTFNSSPGRSLNTCFQISNTNDADFHYGVDSGAVLALGTLTAAVTSYTNSGCTTGAQTENDGTITGLAIGQGATLQLNGTIQAGRWVKITGAVTGIGNAASLRSVQKEVVLP